MNFIIHNTVKRATRFIFLLTTAMCGFASVGNGQSLHDILDCDRLEKALIDEKAFHSFLLNNHFIFDKSDQENNSVSWCLPKYRYGNDCTDCKAKISRAVWDDDKEITRFINVRIEKANFGADGDEIMEMIRKRYPIEEVEYSEDLKNTSVVSEKSVRLRYYKNAKKNLYAQKLVDDFYGINLLFVFFDTK